MFFLLLKKELKVFFTNKGNLVFMFAMPIILVTLLSLSLESYMDADYGTFAEGKVYYYMEQPSAETIAAFSNLSEKIQGATGVVFEETDNYEEAKDLVESSQGYAVITLTESGIDYYRSPYNETNGGKIVRSLFERFTGLTGEGTVAEYVQTVTLDSTPVNSKVYFTFSGLAFAILFMSLLIAHSVYDERELKTIERIKISKAGVSNMFASKIVTGIACGLVQIAVVFLFSTFVLNVTWGSKAPVMFLVLLFLVLYSSVFGAVLGMISKNKSMCQSLVMMITMLCGYLGGAITPLYLLENMTFFNIIIKASPLYWANRALTSLYNGTVDENTFNSIAVLTGLAIAIMLIYSASVLLRQNRQKTTGGVV